MKMEMRLDGVPFVFDRDILDSEKENMAIWGCDMPLIWILWTLEIETRLN
jgi:hypothetical protein